MASVASEGPGPAWKCAVGRRAHAHAASLASRAESIRRGAAAGPAFRRVPQSRAALTKPALSFVYYLPPADGFRILGCARILNEGGASKKEHFRSVSQSKPIVCFSALLAYQKGANETYCT